MSTGKMHFNLVFFKLIFRINYLLNLFLAVYMMALQELTQVPFRCVDEINQGMDEKNERAIWAMLLNVCKEHKAQYFYMAPKFPYSLPFNKQVTI